MRRSLPIQLGQAQERCRHWEQGIFSTGVGYKLGWAKFVLAPHQGFLQSPLADYQSEGQAPRVCDFEQPTHHHPLTYLQTSRGEGSFAYFAD